MINTNIVFMVDESVRLDETTSSRFLHLALVLRNRNIPARIIGPAGSRSAVEGVPVASMGFPFAPNVIGKAFNFLTFPFCCIPQVFKSTHTSFIIRGYILAAILAPLIRLAGKKAVYDFHDFAYQEQAYLGRWMLVPFTWLCEQIALTAATRVIAVSEGIRNKLPRRIQTKTIVLPNGVDAAHFKHVSGRKEEILRRYGLDPDKATVIFNASRMPPWLKLSDLTGAASFLPESYQILVCGDMPYANALRDTVDGKVKFLGRVPFEDLMVLLGDIADVAVNLYDADCYKSRIPGYFENRKMKEYLAAGKPIIVADVPAKESFLNEGQNALFYRSGDPRDLADKIRRLCEDPELAKAMGRNNRTLSLEFTWEKVLERSGLLKDFVQPATGIAAAVPLGS